MLRITSFAKYLLEANWRVSVLTAERRDSVAPNPENEHLIPTGCTVVTARAFDAATHFSIAGKYPGFLEWPDRYSSWIPGAIFAGIRHVRQFPVTHILSTYPIASAHVIGRVLARLTDSKWLADFRDPMLLNGHPETPGRRRAHQWVENKTLSNCTAAAFTNEAARLRYGRTYPNRAENRFHVVGNGYDEAIFERAEAAATNPASTAGRATFRMLHSGTLYPDHRDPRAFFEALTTLEAGQEFRDKTISVVFRASGYDDYYRNMLAREFPTLADIVSFEPPVDYVSSIQEVLASDVLLLFQGASCNEQVPAKLYEYARAQRPILALTNADGATGHVLREIGVNRQADIDDVTAIAELIHCALQPEPGELLPDADVERFSRRRRSQELVALLEEL